MLFFQKDSQVECGVGEYSLCKIRQIGIKENRELEYKVKELGTL